MFRGKLPCYDPALSCHHIHLLSINSRRFAMAYRLRHSIITFASHPTNAPYGWLQRVCPAVETRYGHNIPVAGQSCSMDASRMHASCCRGRFISSAPSSTVKISSFRVNVLLSQLGLVAQSIFPASFMLTDSVSSCLSRSRHRFRLLNQSSCMISCSFTVPVVVLSYAGAFPSHLRLT